MNVTPIPKKKRRARPSTDKRVATELHSKIVRARGGCEYGAGMSRQSECAGRLECAHIVRRRYSATRTDLENGLSLCAFHHRYLDSHLAALITFVGLRKYEALQVKADAGIAATGLSPLMFWRGERERLTKIAKELGL